MDDDNYAKFVANLKDETVRGCEEEPFLNKMTNCFSMQSKKCKTHRDAAHPGQHVNYTHVVIQCEESTLGACMLRWSVDGIFMPEEECWRLGLPCGYWTALIMLLLLGAAGFACFVYRDPIAEFLGAFPVPDSVRDFFKGPWRIFSGRFNGVEEMEARLAERGAGLGDLAGGGGDSILGEGAKEPYQRL